ncbi:hypothetical protein F4818DRAFT_159984 [Hypoxylon cercidicola]|nr:hypothetical protein F4818DRAFT_159984 [Hypoxylon cercidicola]
MVTGIVIFFLSLRIFLSPTPCHLHTNRWWYRGERAYVHNPKGTRHHFLQPGLQNCYCYMPCPSQRRRNTRQRQVICHPSPPFLLLAVRRYWWFSYGLWMRPYICIIHISYHAA